MGRPETGAAGPAGRRGPGGPTRERGPAASLLLSNAVLYDGQLFEADGAVLIRDGRIVAVGPRAEVEAAVQGQAESPVKGGPARHTGDASSGTGAAAPDTHPPPPETIDLGGRMLLPGLMNAHHHLYSSLAAGLAPAGPMDTFPHILENLWWRLDAVHDRDSVRASTWIGLLDALAHGCTTVIDHHASMSYVSGSLDTMAQVFQEAGVRGVLCFETSERAGIEKVEDHLAENLSFWEAHRNDPTLKGMLGLHANLTLSQDTLRHVAAVKPPDLPIHVHVGEAPEDLAFCKANGFDGPVARLDRFGLVHRDSFIIHGIHLDPKDIEILQHIQPVVVTNPQSNANNGVGTFDPWRVRRYLLGTDGMTNDLIATLRYHYLSLQERRLSTDHLRDTFFTFRNEIQNRFFPDTGRLTPGAHADIAVLDYAPVTPISADNALMHLVFGARTAHAHMTLVDGEIRYRAGEFPGLDAAAIRAEARAVAARLHERFRAGS